MSCLLSAPACSWWTAGDGTERGGVEPHSRSEYCNTVGTEQRAFKKT